MLFRVTDERTTAEEFSVVHPSALLLALRRFSQSRLRTQGIGGHPLLALRRRLAWVDAWERERMERPGASDEVRQTWRRQANHWRVDARHAGGINERWALQVQSHDGHWRSTAPMPGTEVWIEVGAELDPPAVQEWWDNAGKILRHIERLYWAANWVVEPSPLKRGEHLRLIAGPARCGADRHDAPRQP